LKIRREVREEPVYELRVADSGFKLQPLKDGECAARDARFGGSQGFERMAAAEAAKDTIWDCDSVGIGGPRNGSPAIPGTRTVKLSGMSLTDLTMYLSLDRIILDKTGIRGLFDLDLTYGVYDSPMKEPLPPLPPGEVPGGESIFTAIQKQLGLRL